MENGATDLDRVLAAIRSAGLRYPDEELLESFLYDSIDTEQAARYALQTCSATRGGGLDLTPLLSDWKRLIAAVTHEVPFHQQPDRAVTVDIWRREGGKCFITGLGNSLFDPLVVAPILPVMKPIEKSLHDILKAFVGPELQRWVLHGESPNAYQRYWLVRKSAATALSQGFYQITFEEEGMYYVTARHIGGPPWPSILDKTLDFRRCRLADHSASDMDTPDVSSLQLLSRFAHPFRWSGAAREIAGKKLQPATKLPSTSMWHFLFPECFAKTLLSTWRLAPASFRILVYRCLGFIGGKVYGSSCSLKVQQLPFGMYLKTNYLRWHEGLANEYGALNLVRQHTRIPVARPLDLVSDANYSYLLTPRVPGDRVGLCIDTLSEEEERLLVHDLQKCIDQLRAIPKDATSQYAISNAVDEACYDFRVIMSRNEDEDFVGPFVDEEQFDQPLRTNALPGVVHGGGHRIFFTPGDLNMRNVLVRNGRFSGIVEWENSGWYPEYWDYTKARLITKFTRRWVRIVDAVFERFGDYESELATERQLWDYCM
ncbi:hypothetical protein PG994_004127 [Apiospora phragmitis]|uniref:Aminoglycoside phosphotransferase domain-containing protein n=1 Tax=Apiospora phragmitis TaxID=2905665 RepID=A0ABR1VPQ0_9PEZI